MPTDKDSIQNTFIVATVVCLVCSLLVSTAAVGLKSIQEKNVALDKKKNILQVAGFEKDEIARVGVDALFGERFSTQIINLETGSVVSEDDEEFAKLYEKLKFSAEDRLEKYDQIKAAKSKVAECCDAIDKSEDIAGIKYREKFSYVYLLKDDSGNVEQYVLPVRGYGLWSTLKGYLAVKPDFQTIVGLTYYEHAETPGLGGEVDNPSWKAKWGEKQIYGDDKSVKIRVVKGTSGDDPFGVDGLSGATITSKGVTNMMQYWLGPKGFGPFIQKIKSKSVSASIKKTGGIDG